MKYNYEYNVNYQEVDGAKKIRLFNLENYILEVAGLVADELGFGIAKLHPMGLTWILTRVSLEMYELPTHCQNLRFETWIESNAHMLSTRDFRIYSNDQLIGICKSVWAVLDLEKREIVRVTLFCLEGRPDHKPCSDLISDLLQIVKTLHPFFHAELRRMKPVIVFFIGRLVP